MRGTIRNISRTLTVLLLAVGLSALGTAPQAGALSNGLGITPRKDYTIPAGKSISDTLYISNLSLNQDLEVDMRVIDFGAAGQTGTPALDLAPNAPQTPWSLKSFIKLPTSVEIPAGKSTYVPFTVTIPAGQGAGSYYSAIEYTAVNPATKQRVNIAASSASLVFVTVPGTTKEQLILQQFGTWQSNPDQLTGQFKSFFVGAPPQEIAYLLQNQGNVAEAPTGSMVVRNMFGHNVIQINDANPLKQLVLIGQTRRIQVCTKSTVENTQNPTTGEPGQESVCKNPSLMPGRYTVQMALFYGMNGNSNQEIDGQASFWYFPWWSIIGFVVLVIVIVLLTWLIRRAFGGGSRRYYRR